MTLSKKLQYVFTSSFLNVTKKRQKNPNIAVHLAFKSKYPKAKFTRWMQIDVFKWRVSFSLRGKEYTGLFDSEGNWMETVTLVPLAFTPKNLQQSFEEKYGSDGLKQIYEIQTPNYTLFEMQWSNGIYALKLVYDMAGKMVGKMIT